MSVSGSCNSLLLRESKGLCQNYECSNSSQLFFKAINQFLLKLFMDLILPRNIFWLLKLLTYAVCSPKDEVLCNFKTFCMCTCNTFKILSICHRNYDLTTSFMWSVGLLCWTGSVCSDVLSGSISTIWFHGEIK